MSREALPEGWDVHAQGGGVVILEGDDETWLCYRSDRGGVEGYCGEEDCIPVPVLRAFLAECERVEGGGDEG